MNAPAHAEMFGKLSAEYIPPRVIAVSRVNLLRRKYHELLLRAPATLDIAPLLADIRHWCANYNVDFHQAVARSGAIWANGLDEHGQPKQD